ncbi:MAG TPA: lysophospholipid acyltransferase family protein [bacterium]
MPAGTLSRFLQTPLNAAVFSWYPPQVTRCYTRLLGRRYFRVRPDEAERHLRQLREVFSHGHRAGACTPALEQQVLQGVFDHYFEKLLLAYWGFARMRRYLLRRVRLVHADLLDDALHGGRGVLVATAHFGAVEFLPASLALRGYPVTAVARFRTAKLKETLVRRASQVGVELLDLDDGAIVPKMLTTLKAGRIFVTELDELSNWRPSAAKIMNFFGRRAALDRALEVLQRRSGSPLLLGLMERLPGRRYQLVLESPVEHHAAPTGLGDDALLLKRLEHHVYEAPDHWYNWKELQRIEQPAAA